MIPVRVLLHNFLCYGEADDGGPVEFDFEGSSLWSISGDNGAGKSAIFDAITYALFGQHRGGAQEDSRLIRKGAAECEAAFEFRLDCRLWRVRRTVGRARGKARLEPKTWQASYFDPELNDWRPVPETERKAGLDRWVEQQLGFGYQTFVASVLLLQGESDRLALAKPKERFDILSGLLELEAYQRLEAAADERARTARREAETLEGQLAALPQAADDELKEAQVGFERSEQALERAQALAAQVEVLVQEATRYAALERDLADAEAQRQATEALLEDAPRIRCGYEEWRCLSHAVPKLRSALDDLSEAERQTEHADEASARAAGIDLPALEHAAEEAGEAERDAECGSAEVREQHQSLAEALPPLRDVLSRQRELAGREGAAQRAGPVEQWEAEVAERESELRERERDRQQAEEERRNAIEAVARAEAALSEAEGQLRARRDAKDEAICSRCGQCVDAQHIRRELRDAEEALAEGEQRLEVSRADHTQAARRADEAAGRVEEAQSALSGAGDALGAARRADEERRHAQRQLAAAIEAATPVSDKLRAAVIEAPLAAAEKAIRRLDAQIAKGAAAVRDAERAEKEAREAYRKAERALHDARTALERLQGEARRLREKAGSLRQQAEVRLADVPSDWRERALAADEAFVETLAQRLRSLDGVEQRHQALAQAEAKRDQLEARMAELARTMESVLAEHRLPVDEAGARRAGTLAALREAQACRDAAREALRRLEQARQRRCEAERGLANAQRRRALYSRLAELLGRSGLQAYLIDEAIQGITTLANETLARISGGQLQLQILRLTSAKGEEEIAIRATDLASSEEPLDMPFLSGSQKFRASVALAAGIGQYAGRGAGSIRSLIIDEGFGSLDTEGRQEMIDELRNLSQLMDRVIVVSHQEDFQDRTLFPTGYVLRKDGQRTAVERFV